MASSVDHGAGMDDHQGPAPAAGAAASCDNTPVAKAATTLYEVEARGLSYRVARGRRVMMEVLSDVSCVARPGEMLAIAGPSGAGKSTLLEVLAGRLRPSSGPATLLVNKAPMDVPAFRRVSGFIPQADALFPLLTVRETLAFSAALRLPSTGLAPPQQAARVSALLEELGLSRVAHSRVVDLSGGERRRVSVGVDVIHDPSVLFLDEPTSGLDSAAAASIVDMLDSMAFARKRTIVISIHQPGYKILQLIHSFLLLNHGRVVHHGSLGLLERQLIADGNTIPPQVNVLEYTMDTLMSDPNFHVRNLTICVVKDKRPKANGYCKLHPEDGYVNVSPIKENGHSKQPAIVEDDGCCTCTIKKSGRNSSSLATINKPTYGNSPVQEVMILAHRFALNIFRTKGVLTTRACQAIIAGIGLGTLFYKAGFSASGVHKRMGFFAFTLTFLLSTTVEALPIFLQEKHVLIPETSRGAYRVGSYVMANVLVFLPYLLGVAVLYSVPVYWLIGLSTSASAFAYFVIIMWMVLLTANSFVASVSVLVSDFIVGNTVICALQGTFFLFSGFFIAKRDMPMYWRWMNYLSLFKYPLDALLINEYTSDQGKCFGQLSLTADEETCNVTSENVLQRLDLQNASKWTDMSIMLAFIVGYRLICFAVLRYKVHKRRR